MKTIEEAAKEYADKTWVISENREWDTNDFKAGVEFAQRWIPIEEESPEKGVYVLCKVNTYLPFIGNYSGEEMFFKSAEDPYTRILITHWRPIDIK